MGLQMWGPGMTGNVTSYLSIITASASMQAANSSLEMDSYGVYTPLTLMGEIQYANSSTSRASVLNQYSSRSQKWSSQ